jgi:hypothetical protein
MQLFNEYAEKRTIYNPILHPDFEGWKALREDRIKHIIDYFKNNNFFMFRSLKYVNEDEYEAIPSPFYFVWNNTCKRATGIDLGCHYGYNDHMLESAGAIMTGIEYLPDYYERALFLNRTYGQNVHFIHKDILEYIKENPDKKFDFAIALSVLYTFNDADSMKIVAEWLVKNCEVIIFDAHEKLGIEDLKGIFKISPEKHFLDSIYKDVKGREVFAFHKKGKYNGNLDG